MGIPHAISSFGVQHSLLQAGTSGDFPHGHLWALWVIFQVQHLLQTCGNFLRLAVCDWGVTCCHTSLWGHLSFWKAMLWFLAQHL